MYLLYWCSCFEFLFSCSMFRLMLYNLFLFSCSHCFTNCFPQFSFTDSASILNDKGEDTDSFVAVHSESCLTVHQAPLSMGFSRQKYWSGLPFPSPGDMENPGYPWVSFPTLGSNPDLLHCRQILYQLGNKGKLLSQPKPRIKRLGLNGGTRLGTQI